jgi:hypothetical protein
VFEDQTPMSLIDAPLGPSTNTSSWSSSFSIWLAAWQPLHKGIRPFRSRRHRSPCLLLCLFLNRIHRYWDPFVASFGDELDNVISGLDRSTPAAEVITEQNLAPRYAPCPRQGFPFCLPWLKSLLKPRSHPSCLNITLHALSPFVP